MTEKLAGTTICQHATKVVSVEMGEPAGGVPAAHDSREREARSTELLFHDGVQTSGHLWRHVVPISCFAPPEVGVISEGAFQHHSDGRRRRRACWPVDVEVSHLLEAAQRHDVRDDPSRLLILRERLPDELGKLPGAAQHVLGPQEQHRLRARLAGIPVPEDMVQDGAAQTPAVAGRLEHVEERQAGLHSPAQEILRSIIDSCAPF